MRKYRTGGSSKATSTTLCQKCLQRGHYTYECTTSQQDRPYSSRPSRSQQLQNPKLVPKLRNIAPEEASSKNLPRDTTRHAEGVESRIQTRCSDTRMERSSSVSSDTSISVSSFSSNDGSRSHSIEPTGRGSQHRRSNAVERRNNEHGRSRLRKWSLSPRASKGRSYRSRSRSPRRDDDREMASAQCRRSRSPYRSSRGQELKERLQRSSPPRERSLSPYSKRVALSNAGP